MSHKKKWWYSLCHVRRSKNDMGEEALNATNATNATHISVADNESTEMVDNINKLKNQILYNNKDNEI